MVGPVMVLTIKGTLAREKSQVIREITVIKGSGVSTRSSRPAVPNFLAPGTGSVEDNFSTDVGGGHGGCPGGNASDGGAVDEASLACPPLTSCCGAGS